MTWIKALSYFDHTYIDHIYVRSNLNKLLQFKTATSEKKPPNYYRYVNIQ